MISSDALFAELEKGSNEARRESCLDLAAMATDFVPHGVEVRTCVGQLFALGLKEMDASHLASAAIGGADIFLTVDDELLRKGRRILQTIGISVASPVGWLENLAQGGKR